MPSYRYRIVDVFARTPLEGNPLAVFPDALAIDDRTMQSIAREMNLSETVFTGWSTLGACAAKVRIFTPTLEMPFAGHPTIGAAFVLRDEGIVPAETLSFALEENIGPVAIRVDPGDSRIWLRTPPIAFGAEPDPALAARAVGLADADLLPSPPSVVGAGNPVLFIAVRDPAAVDRAAVDPVALGHVDAALGGPPLLFVFAPVAGGAYSRMFAPGHGVVEDPATGSATGPLAAYMLRNGMVGGGAPARFVSEQGVKMGRRSLLHVDLRSPDEIYVGGDVVPVAEGTLTL